MERTVILREIANFRRARAEALDEAKLEACLHLAGAGPYAGLKRAAPAELARIEMRLKRGVERERFRGMARHRLYSLERHIMLKRALDEVRRLSQKQNGAGAPF